jgi:hypothetical protein
MKGRPRFFCEHCGKEVPREAEKCASCGRYFSSVRCPKCGFAGAQNLFSDGCPVCAYSAPPPPGRDAGEAPFQERLPALPAGTLPSWVYLVTLAALAAVIAAAVGLLR